MHSSSSLLLRRVIAEESENEIRDLQFIFRLPPELLIQILSYLGVQPLTSLTRTCRQFKTLAESDFLWADILQQIIPQNDFPLSPYPAVSYRSLYIAHHPYWFLPTYKIWFSDDEHLGKLILIKFDPRRGCIEGYRLLADKGPTTGLHWSYRPTVLIHTFTPRVHLFMDDPVLKLPYEITSSGTKGGWWEGEIRMSVGQNGHNTSATFFLSRDVPMHRQVPSMDLWPPRTIPDVPRVRRDSPQKFRDKSHKPQKLDEISQTTFRMRHWSQFGFNGSAALGVRLGESVSTWSSLDPKLYTPTPEKPYQGIYVGDYAGHGCEFLLVLHLDVAPRIDQRLGPRTYFRAVLNAMENLNLEAERSDDKNEIDDTETPANIPDGVGHQGALVAIKITGDPNIPRGEYTFIAQDIGHAGLIRIAREEPFYGARVVKSVGHVAGRGFQNDEFITSQLFLINENRLAQYWVSFGHISFYERVDIDSVLVEQFDRRRASG